MNTYVRLYSRINSPVLDDKLDVWPGGAAGGLPDALKPGDGDDEAGQVAFLDDEVDVVDKIKRPRALDVALGGEAVAGLRFDGIELDLQRVLESRGLQRLKGAWGEEATRVFGGLVLLVECPLELTVW